MAAGPLDSDAPDWAGDLFGEVHIASTAPPPRQASWSQLLPGVTICAVASAAAAWFSDHYGMPIILMGLILGLALQFVSADPRSAAGLDFVGRRCLRLGIVVLGLQVTITQIGALGLVPFGALLAVMAAAAAAAVLGARLSGQSVAVGILAGGATAICGASAALALYGVIGRSRVNQAQFTLTLVVISLASALAMTIYPVLAEAAHFNARQAGFLTGAAIHDVAQSIGGGYAVSNAAGAAATVVKLTRVALLGPLVALAAVVIARVAPVDDSEAGDRGQAFGEGGNAAVHPRLSRTGGGEFGDLRAGGGACGVAAGVEGAAVAGGNRHRHAHPDRPHPQARLEFDTAGSRSNRHVIPHRFCFCLVGDSIAAVRRRRTSVAPSSGETAAWLASVVGTECGRVAL